MLEASLKKKKKKNYIHILKLPGTMHVYSYLQLTKSSQTQQLLIGIEI